MTHLPWPTYAEAVIELARLSRWSRADVVEQPSDAGWQGHAWVARCVRVIEAGDR